MIKLANPKSDDSLRRFLRRLDIRWPGDGDYGHGVMVFLVASFKVVRLVQQLGEPGSYLIEGGRVYVERRTSMGYVQELRPWKGGEIYIQEPVPSFEREVTNLIIAYIEKHHLVPTVLHISYEDLVRLGKERSEIAVKGDVWGLSIVLERKGEHVSVDRRIEL